MRRGAIFDSSFWVHAVYLDIVDFLLEDYSLLCPRAGLMHAHAGNAPLIPAYLALNCNSNSLTLRAARRLSTYASQVLTTVVGCAPRTNKIGAPESLFLRSLHFGCGHTPETAVASHFTKAAFTLAGFSCAIQWPERIVASVRLRQYVRMGSANRE